MQQMTMPELEVLQRNEHSTGTRFLGLMTTARSGTQRFFLLAYLFFILAVIGAATPSFAEPIDAGNRTLKVRLYSEVLDEHREFWIRLPEDYNKQPGKRFPVFYVSDADWNFPLVAETLEYLSHWGSIPPFIVVGATNVSRNRDFLPREDAAFPSSGQGDRYLRHFAEEMIPWINESFRTSDKRVLFGHSFGGVLVINQLLSQPDLFDAYISLGASVWVSNEVLLERATQFFDQERPLDTWLYLSVGEGDGGATVPAGRKFADLLEARAPDTLEWSHTVMPEETHFTNVPISLHKALSALFPTWGDDRALEEAGRNGGSEAVAAWFEGKRNDLGWRFAPQSLDLGLAALRLSLDGHVDAGLAAFELLGKALPESPAVAQLKGQALAGIGRHQEALVAVNHAIKLAQAAEYHADQLRRFTEYRDRVVEQARSNETGG